MAAPGLEPVRETTYRIVHLAVAADQVDAEEAPALVHVTGEHEDAGVAGGASSDPGAPPVTHRRRLRMRAIVGGGRGLGRHHMPFVRRHLEGDSRAAPE